MSTPTHIIRLEAENLKRLRAIAVEPKGSTVVIGGKNAQGKTSLLDSIEYALAGGRSIPDEPIRKGESKARIVLKLDNGLVVTRTFSARGSQLVVNSADGAKASSPQKVLDDLTGAISFDPLGFSRMHSKDQVAVVRDLVGLDFSAADKKRKELFDERTEVNRDRAKLESQIDGIPFHPNAPAEELSVEALTKEMNDARDLKEAHEANIRAAEKKAHDAEVLRDEIRELEEKLEAKRASLGAAEEEHARFSKQIEEDIVPDLTPIQEKISKADSLNQQVRDNKNREALQKDLLGKQHKARELSNQIDAIDKDKKEQLAKAQFPVDGLSFDDSGVRFNGVQIQECSAAERTRISTAMAMAMNPKLGVILVRDGSLLDDESLAVITEMATERGYQVWIERVGDGAECTVVIEDGSVRAETVAQ